MKRSAILVSLVMMCCLAYAQDYPLTDSLKLNLQNAKTPAEKVRWLGELFSFYISLNKELSEGYGKKQMQVAELSRDRELMIKALLSHANAYYNYGGLQENINKAKNYSQQALDLARTNQMDEYVSRAYIYLARGARNNGENDKALNYNNLAISIASSGNNDTLKISALNSLGETYLARKEKLLAFRNYTQALNLAEQINSFEQLKNCYFNISEFYLILDDFEKSKDYLFKVQQLTKTWNKPYSRLDFYNALGDVYTNSKKYDLAIDYYERAIALSDTLGFSLYKINCYSRILSQYLSSNQSEKALRYFKEKKELRDFMKTAGVDYVIDYAYGLAYSDLNKFDSAQYYFKRAESGFEKKASNFNKYYFYQHVARLYAKKKEPRTSLDYWLKAKAIANERGDIELLQNISNNLDSVYQMLGDYKNSRYYNAQYHHFKDSLQQLSTEKDLLRFEVENENKRKEKEAKLAEDVKRERHNVQYMGITAGIAAVFIVLVMMGAFSVSKTTIRILGFFAFIFLFEFIILLADNQIHHWTHGEPWKILAIKILLISILLPLHHFLEERVIHYLTSKKLAEMKTKGLMSKISGKSEADPVSS